MPFVVPPTWSNACAPQEITPRLTQGDTRDGGRRESERRRDDARAEAGDRLILNASRGPSGIQGRDSCVGDHGCNETSGRENRRRPNRFPMLSVSGAVSWASSPEATRRAWIRPIHPDWARESARRMETRSGSTPCGGTASTLIAGSLSRKMSG